MDFAESFFVEEMRVKLVSGHVIDPEIDRCDKGFVGGVKAGEQVVDEFVVAEGRTSTRDLICECLGSAKVICDAEVLFLQHGQLPSDLIDPSSRLGGEHPFKSCPDRRGRGEAEDASQHLRQECGKHRREDQLVLDVPL